MSFRGLENVGQAFAPIADAQLKEAYADYQTQKDLSQMESQFIQNKIAEQQAAQSYGYDSPRISRIPIDPFMANYLGPQLGVDPSQYGQAPNPLAPTTNVGEEVKMAAQASGLDRPQEEQFSGDRKPFSAGGEEQQQPRQASPLVQELARKYPDLVDQQGRIHPYFAKRAQDLQTQQAKLEAEAQMLTGRSLVDLYKNRLKEDMKLNVEKEKNLGRKDIQSMKGDVALKIQDMKNKGMTDKEILSSLSREKVAGVKASSSERIQEMRESGLGDRAKLQYGTQKEIQGMKARSSAEIQESKNLADYVKMLGETASAEKIAQGKQLSEKEIQQIKIKNDQFMQEKDLGSKYGIAKLGSETDKDIEKMRIGAGAYKKYPPVGRSGTGASARPLPYKKDSYEESLLKEIDGYNKVKVNITASTKEKAEAQKGIEEAKRLLLQYRQGGAATQAPAAPAQGFKPPGAPQAYYDWLKKFNAQPSPNNWKQYQAKQKGK